MTPDQRAVMEALLNALPDSNVAGPEGTG